MTDIIMIIDEASIEVLTGDTPPPNGLDVGGTEYLRADTAIPVAEVRALVERWVAQSNLGHLDPSYHLALADCAAELRQLMGEE